MIQANNYKLYTEQEGNSGGPSILFIHGLGGTTNTFQPILSPLQDFNLIRFDFAGHGRSETPEKTSIDSYVEDCEGQSTSLAHDLLFFLIHHHHFSNV